MTVTFRQIISVLLSLLLVMSGSALAISEIAVGQPDSAMADCGSIMMDHGQSASSSSDAEMQCAIMPDMACPGMGGLSNCGVISVGLLPTAPASLIDTGSQPAILARATNYQDPFLASITPPPLDRS